MTTRRRSGNNSALMTATALFAVVVLSCSARAQIPSLEAFQGIYAQNGGPNGPFTQVTGNGGPNDASDPFISSAIFTGLDSQNQQQTMNISGTAYSSASYGQVHVYGADTITNPYYNAANPAYVNPDGSVNTSGSPQSLSVHGNAGWSDSLTYTGLQGTGYKVDYYFQLDGTVSGNAAAGLNFSTSDPNAPSYNPRTTQGSALWITPFFQVNWGVPTDISVDFFGGTTSDLSLQPEGVTFSDLGDYSNTLTLAGIQVVDADNNPVSGWSLTAASGADYPLMQGQATPEPGSLAMAIGLGMTGASLLLRRRRR